MACTKAFGMGAVCFEPGDAVRLAALMGVLTGLYLDRVACDAAAVPAAQ